MRTAIIKTRPMTFADARLGATGGRALNVASAVKLVYDAAVYVGAVIPCSVK
jgi:hypothetical protein